jgi:hypothetical protein
LDLGKKVSGGGLGFCREKVERKFKREREYGKIFFSYLISSIINLQH